MGKRMKRTQQTFNSFFSLSRLYFVVKIFEMNLYIRRLGKKARLAACQNIKRLKLQNAIARRRRRRRR